MSISSISSSLWLQTLAAQQRKGVERQGPNLQSDISHLTNSLRSGDLDAAKSDYATITSRMPTQARPQDAELTSALSAVGAALESGDLDAAREALANVQEMVKDRVAQGPPPPPPPDAQGAQGTGDTTGGVNPIEQLLSQLTDALASNDLDSAKNAYELLQSFLKTQTGTSSDDSSTLGTTSTSRRIDCFA
jgi:hypothetical protein